MVEHQLRYQKLGGGGAAGFLWQRRLPSFVTKREQNTSLLIFRVRTYIIKKGQVFTIV